MKNKIILLIAVFFSYHYSWAVLPESLPVFSQYILSRANNMDMRYETCRDEMENLSKELFELKPHQHFQSAKLAKTPSEFFMATGLKKQSSNDPITNLFAARTKISEKYYEWIKKNEPSPQEVSFCANQVRKLARAIRSQEEFWSLMQVQRLSESGYKFTPAMKLSPLWPQGLVNPKYTETFRGRHDFKSGDVILSRGTNFTGAVISRIGSIDNQFSHIAIVVHDEDGSIAKKIKNLEIKEHGKSDIKLDKGQNFVVESLMQGGVKIKTLDNFLDKDSFARISVFRLRNVTNTPGLTEAKVVANKAANAILNRRLSEGPICYNFSMNPEDDKCLFCSQTLAWAIEQACKGLSCDKLEKFKASKINKVFPLIYTTYNTEKNELAQILEIAKESFSPADIEVDPRLEMLAEWRDLNELPVARANDMVMTKVFQWIEEGGYKFKPMVDLDAFSFLSNQLIKDLGQMPENTPAGFVKGTLLLYFISEWNPNKVPMLGKKAIDSMPDEVEPTAGAPKIPNVAKQMAEHFMESMGLTSRLLKFEKEFALTSTDFGKFYLSEERMSALLERIRVEDCQLHIKTGKSDFHSYFAQSFLNKEKACNPQPFILKNF